MPVIRRIGDAKVVIIGNSGVGKTSLMERFVFGKFSGVRGKTLGATYVSKEVVRGNQSIKIAIWDTAGTERQRSLTPNFYRHAKAAIVCFDLTDNVSWQVLKTWVSELKESEPNCKIVICATKKDLVDAGGQGKRDVAQSAIDLFNKSYQVPYIETSSRSGENVERLFSIVVDEIWDDVIAAPNIQACESLRVISEPTPKKSCSCTS